MNDPRLGLTSASSALADSLCPARFLRQQGLPETTSEDAEAGTRMHEAYAADNADTLESADERKTVELALERDKAIVGAWAELVNAVEDSVERWITEKRLYGYDFAWPAEAAEWAVDGVCHSGQPDKAWRCRDSAHALHILIDDFKSGRVPVEQDNLQLRDLASLVYEMVPGVESVTVAINQPWAPGKPLMVRYMNADLSTAWGQMVQRVLASHDPNAKAVPGEEQCKYCRALATCPEAQKALIPAQALALAVPIKRGAAQAIARGLTLEDQARIWKQWDMADKVFKAIDAELKKTDPALLADVGLGFEDGDDRRTITDMVGLWNRLAKLGVSQQQFLACVKVTIGKVRDAVQTVTGITAHKELEAKMDALLAGVTETKQCAKSLVEVKEAKA